jgi:3-oxoacyl-[acyl-carrier protein] reductase
LAKELIADRIFVNAVAPGPIETELLRQVSEDHLRVMLSKTPMARLAQPAECAALVLWLSSDAASFNTGAIFDLSGGRATY